MTLLEFTAEWCQGCKALGVLLDKLKPEFPFLKIVEIDVAKEGDVATRYRVGMLPTCVIVDDEGSEIARLAGQPAYGQLKRFIQMAMEE